MTKFVFAETDPVTRPPSDSIIRLASSRVIEAIVPVRTKVLSMKGLGPAVGDASVGKTTPPRRSLDRSVLVSGNEKNCLIELATTGPISRVS